MDGPPEKPGFQEERNRPESGPASRSRHPADVGWRLDEASLREATGELSLVDPGLARAVERYGTPPLWAREPGFATLVHLILEQQVSLASAQAAMDRLIGAVGPPTPTALLKLDDRAMLEIGFSRQKRDYARGLAVRIREGALDLDALDALPNETVRQRLTEVKGIGAWTADIYLLAALARPDVWPVGDRALVVAVRILHALREDPTPDRMTEIGEPWRPWRSVAARILWHLYLSEVRPLRGAGTRSTRQR